MKKCVPSCCKKSSESSAAIQATELPSEQQVFCGVCRTLQSVSKDATVFVCLSCHTVNRVNPLTAEVVTVDNPPIQPATEMMTLRRINSSTFIPIDGVTQTASTAEVQTPASVSIGPCSVCMDGAGDMIFLNCHHGGFCEPCARHIAQNMAVGGSHCPRCREPIVALARIVRVEKDLVKAVSVEVQTGEGCAKAPPKVPAPRGFNKVKKQ